MRKLVSVLIVLSIFGLCCFSNTVVLAAPSLDLKLNDTLKKPNFKIDFNANFSTKKNTDTEETKQNITRKDVSYKTSLPPNYKWGVKPKKNYKLYDSNGVQHGDAQTFAFFELKNANAKKTYIKNLTADYRNSLLRKKKVSLKWDYTGKNKIKYYLVYRRINSGEWEEIGKTKKTKLEDKQIKTDGTYDYRVTAFYTSSNNNKVGELCSAEISLEIGGNDSGFSLF
ncbi:MAG: hypothetical protein ACOX2X_03655 [Peptococcia bacterium]|jgi:hypothetical protein